MKIVGEQLGGANKSEEGAILELNVEKTPELSIVIHELIHLKWPEDIQQAENSVNKIEKKVSDELVNAGFSEFLNDSEIQNERSKALKAFELLDADFEKILMN